jgi:hypothetical protein
MTRRKVSLTVFATVAALCTACAGSGSGSTTSNTPAPSTGSGQSPTSSSASNLPFAGAPTVANPLPASVLSGDPCSDAFTPAQAEDFLGAPLDRKRADLQELGPQCRWSNLNQGSQISIGYDVKTRVGLSGLYENTKTQVGVWKPIPDVGGFPAVAHAGEPGQMPKDLCVTSVGLANDLSINVSVYVSKEKQGTLDPCDASTDVANAVVATLKSKAGS